MQSKTFLIVGFLAASWAVAGDGAEESLLVGEFTAVRFDKPPVIDGHVSAGEWDRAFTTSGLIAPLTTCCKSPRRR